MSLLKQIMAIYTKNRMVIAAGLFMVCMLVGFFMSEANDLLLFTMLFLSVAHMLIVVYFEAFSPCSFRAYQRGRKK